MLGTLTRASVQDVIDVEKSKLGDRVQAMGRGLGIRCGFGVAALVDGGGDIVALSTFQNLVTQIGDQAYGERATGISSPPAQVTGMKLGTGSTAVAKTGAGAALTTYLSGSDKALDATFPQSALNGSSRQITFQTTWGAGVATTASAITEVVIMNDTLADATSTAANTWSRALLTGIGSKGASDSLIVSWTHSLLGA